MALRSEIERNIEKFTWGVIDMSNPGNFENAFGLFGSISGDPEIDEFMCYLLSHPEEDVLSPTMDLIDDSEEEDGDTDDSDVEDDEEEEDSAVPDYSWRLTCMPNPVDVDPDDYETEDEYNDEVLNTILENVICGVVELRVDCSKKYPGFPKIVWSHYLNVQGLLEFTSPSDSDCARLAEVYQRLDHNQEEAMLAFDIKLQSVGLTMEQILSYIDEHKAPD